MGEPAPTPDGWARLRITPRGGDIRERVATALSDSGVLVRELATEAASLEQFYLKTIEEDDPAAAHAAIAEGSGA